MDYWIIMSSPLSEYKVIGQQTFASHSESEPEVLLRLRIKNPTQNKNMHFIYCLIHKSTVWKTRVKKKKKPEQLPCVLHFLKKFRTFTCTFE